MSTATTKALEPVPTTATPTTATQPQLSGGLYLSGTVIAIRTEEKEWEKEKYTQTTVSISDGETVYLFRHRHTPEPFQFPALFQPVRVKITRANTEKGQITVGGTFLKAA